MKKLFVFSLLFLLGACAEGSIYKKYDQDCNDHFYSRKDCPAKEEKAKAPEKVYVYREARPEPRRITPGSPASGLCCPASGADAGSRSGSRNHR